MASLPENLAGIQQRIQAACDRSGRPAGSVKLLAVSKSQPPDSIEQAAQCGLALFGENKVQEARHKIALSPGRLRWHFIGHLQTNKVREAVELFEMIQTVDSLPLALEIQKRCQQAAKTMPVLLEINVAGESSKHGYAPARLLSELKDLAGLDRLQIQGVMAIPPFNPSPEQARPHFRQLRTLRDQAEQVLGFGLPHLSMGMSGDFEVAIEEGSTLVRLGTALFGQRQSFSPRDH